MSRISVPSPGVPGRGAPAERIGFLKRHSLSIASLGVLLVWLLLYITSDSKTHLGSFFGNAIADWTGVVVTVIATKHLYEIGPRSKSHPRGGFGNRMHHALRNHALTIFLLLTGIGWVLLYVKMDSEEKWGQVVGNIVSEWTQILGFVLMTKHFIERKSTDRSPAK